MNVNHLAYAQMDEIVKQYVAGIMTARELQVAVARVEFGPMVEGEIDANTGLSYRDAAFQTNRPG